MDRISTEKRSWNMSKISAKNTKPEITVRSVLHSLGYRYRLHGKISKKNNKKGFLPGKPDIILAKYDLVIFVNGCFWHMHDNCERFRLPKSNTIFWKEKLMKNKIRDEKNIKLLKASGWKVLVIWECEIEMYRKELREFIDTKMREIIE